MERTNEELKKRVLLLQRKVEQLKTAGVLQKTARAEVILEDAIYLLDLIVTEVSKNAPHGYR